jgi:hypothetical protein
MYLSKSTSFSPTKTKIAVKLLIHFAVVHVENEVNDLLGYGFPLKILKINNSCDWKNLN